MNVSTSISPSLHPANVEAIAGYNEDTADSVSDVRQAFLIAYESIGAVNRAREAAMLNPALNEAARILAVADFGEKHFEKIAKAFDAAASRLKRDIAGAQRTLAQPFEVAATGGLTAEIRAHARGLTESERRSFVGDAIDAADMKTIGAVLGAPHYLSGLNVAERDLYIRRHHERTNPLLAKRLAVMKAAQDLMDARSGLIFSDIERAVGASGERVAKIRAANAKAVAAYTFTA